MNPTLVDLQQRYPDLVPIIPSIEAAYDLLAGTFRNGGKLLICGNGGSAADSDHIVGELMKAFERPRPISDEMRQRLHAVDAANADALADQLQGALPTISLVGQSALISAISNDVSGDMVFAQQVYGYGRAGDSLIAISTSGSATNVLHALRVAKALNMHTIGLTGRTGGKMRDFCDVAICVPYERTLQVQERHLPIYHALSIMLENEFFP